MTPAADKPLHRTHAGDDRFAGLTARIRNVTGGPQEFEFKGTFNYPILSVVGSPLFATGEVSIIPNSPPVTS